MKWTEAMLAAAKGNERPFGLAKGAMIETLDSGKMSVAELIQSAWREGAKIQCYEGGIWSVCEPFWSSSMAYRVHADWQPEPKRTWCMCTELKAVTRDSYSTCSVCGGADAYGRHPHRPADKRKVLAEPEPAKSAATVDSALFPPCAVTHCPFRRESP